MQTVKRVSAIVGILFLLPSASLAQQTPGVQQAPQQQSDLNDTQLRSFARVFVQVEKILETYGPKMKESKTPEEGQELQNEERSKIEQALREEGMDAQSFHRIVKMTDADEGLRQKVIGFINEERQKTWT